MAQLSLAIICGLRTVLRTVCRPFFITRNKKHQIGSAPRARKLSLSGVFSMKTSRVRMTLNLDAQTSSAPRARKLSLFERRASGVAVLLVVAGLLPVAAAFVPSVSEFDRVVPFSTRTATAAPADTLNFQGRLLQNTGALVPDGEYHVEFKLYDAVTSTGSSQGACTGDANCLWTETRTTGSLVTISNGYYSIYLGDVTALPDIDWSQELYLGMNIGGDAGAAVWDGEMTPRFRLTAVPYAFRAANVASSDTNAASTASDGVSITTGSALGATSDSGDLTIDTGAATGTTGAVNLGATNASALIIGNGSATTTLQGAVVLTGTGAALDVQNNATLGSDGTDTLTVNADATFTDGLTVQTGDTFTNAGSTLLSALAVSDLPTGGDIGTAAATVDVATTFDVSQTTAAQTLTLPDPTDTTSGRVVYINNIGSEAFTVYGDSIGAGESASFIWNGSDWVQTISFTNTGVDNLGVIGSTPNAEGATISGTTLTLQPASDLFGGVVTTAAQTFAGVKTFNDDVVIAAGDSLVLAGGNTASRPDPTLQEGEIYYDSEADELLISDGATWSSVGDGGSEFTYVVAATDSVNPGAADYVADGDTAAAGDGDQIEINAAITAANVAGGGTVYLMEGTYTIDASIVPLTNVAIVGSGDGTLITFPDGLDPAADIYAIENSTTVYDVTIRNLTIDANLDGQGNDNVGGIEVRAGGGSGAAPLKGASIRDINIYDTEIALNLTGSHYSTVDGLFIDCNASGNIASGIQMSSATNITFTNNSINDCPTSYLSADDSVYANNIFSNSGYSNISSYGAIDLNSSDGSVFEGNVVRSSIGYGLNLGGANDIVVSDNVIEGSSRDNILCSSATNVVISNNRIVGSSLDGIELALCNDVIIEGNYIAANAIGIYFANISSNNKTVVTNNVIESNTAEGIFAWNGVHNLLIVDNVFNTNGDNGVELRGTNDSIVRSNIFYDNGGTTSAAAVLIQPYIVLNGDNNQVVDNTFYDSAGTSNFIDIAAGSDNTYVAGNMFDGSSVYNQNINDAGTNTIYSSQLTQQDVLRSDASEFVSSRSTDLTGTVAVTAASPTVTGTGTAFTSELEVGDNIIITDTTEQYTVLSIASDTSLTLTADVTTADASSAATRQAAPLAVRDSSGNTDLVVTESGDIYTPNLANCIFETDANGLIGCGAALSPDLADNTVDAFDLQEGANDYININTTDASEAITFGNTTTNPDYTFLGSGEINLGESSSSITVSQSITTDDYSLGVSTASGRKITLSSEQGTFQQAVVVSDADSATDTIFGVSTSNDSGTTWNPALTVSQDGDTTIGESLILTGGATLPGTPTEGEIFYDSDDQILYIYTDDGTDAGWEQLSGGNENTIVVAASDSINASVATPRYRADGTDDHLEINSAISAVNAAGGGTVYLLEGTYTITTDVNMSSNVQLIGSGAGTVITIPTTQATDLDIIEASSDSDIYLGHFSIDGQSATTTATDIDGIFLNNASRATVEEVLIQNIDDVGFVAVNTTDNVRIRNITIDGTGGNGVEFGGTALKNTILSGSTITNIGGDAINVYNTSPNATDIIIENNYIDGSGANSVADEGIVIDGSNVMVLANYITGVGDDGINLGTNSSDVSLVSNYITDSTDNGIRVFGGSNHTITGNTIENSAEATSDDCIFIDSVATGVIVTDNRITDTAGTGSAIEIETGTVGVYLADNVFSGTGAADINDNGTSTVYANQLDGAIGSNGNLQLQAAGTGSVDILSDATIGTDSLVVDISEDFVGIGTATPDARLELAGDQTAAAWSTDGIQLQASAATYTDNTSTGTVAATVFNSFAEPLLDASAGTVTFTDVANVYIAGAPALDGGSDDTINNAYALWVDNDAVRFDGGLTLGDPSFVNCGALITTAGVVGCGTGEGTNEFTRVVAATDSLNSSTANYTASATSAETEINQAIADVVAAGGGTVFLLEGTYTIDGSILLDSNVSLRGSGIGVSTIFSLAGATDFDMITASSDTNVTIRDLTINGNETNVTGDRSSIALTSVGSGTGTTATTGFLIDNVEILDSQNDAIEVVSSANSAIRNVKIVDVGTNVPGIDVTSSERITIADSFITGTSSSGIRFTGTKYSIIQGNTLDTNGDGSSDTGIWLTDDSDYNTIDTNVVSNNTGIAIRIGSGTSNGDNVVSNNIISGNTQEAIYLGSLTFDNLFSGNVIRDNEEDGGAADSQIFITGNSDNNQFIGNHLDDDTVQSYAVYIDNSGAADNYFSDNVFKDSDGIVDNGTNTLFAGQLTGDPGSDGDYTIQAAGTGDLLLEVSDIVLGEGDGVAQTLTVAEQNTNIAGADFTLTAGDAGSGAGSFDGGSVYLNGGAGVGTGTQGLVVVENLTFGTATAQVCAADCTITQANVDATGAVIIDATATEVEVLVPEPSITVAGRIMYVSAADNSSDFTLTLNDATLNEINISLRENETATLVWNGADWTAAGASSSNTLQSAYNNTLTSAGGAEIILNAPGGDADGLTVRNNDITPIIGAIFEAQTSIGSNLFSVNNNATEYADNGGAEDAFAGKWSGTPDGGTVTRFDTPGDYIATGLGSVSVVAGTTANEGAENTLTQALTPNLRYSVSFAVRGTANFSTLDVFYSPDGLTASEVACENGENLAQNLTVTEGTWTRYICTFDAPASGITASNSVFIRDSSTTSHTYYIENLSVTIKADVNHAVDGDIDDAGAFGINYTRAVGTELLLERNTGIIYNTSGSANVTTNATAGEGIVNNLAIEPSTETEYLVTLYAQSSNTFTDLQVQYSPDGGTTRIDCADYNTRDISTSSWTLVTCSLSTDTTTVTDADLFVIQETGVSRDFYIDGIEMTLNTNTASSVQIGGGSLGGPTTLLTLDRSAGPPVAANNDAYLGSMYYDTTTGRIQCYESGGWGTCGSPPDNIVNLNPEYAGSVLEGSGVGTMTAEVCANGGGLSVNAAICDETDTKTRNYYQWTSPQATDQTYSIYVTYQLPSTFDGFSSDDTVQLTGRVDDASLAEVSYEMFRSEGGNLNACGTETNVAGGGSGSADEWYTVGINGNEATGCSFTSSSANAFVLFKINLTAEDNANAYVSTLTFTTTGR